MIPGLLVTEGPQKGCFIKIPEHLPYWIGRSEKANFVLKKESYISLKHCFFIRNGSTLELMDQSSNGTRINGVLIQNERITLKMADIIRLGEIRFQVINLAPFDALNYDFEQAFADYQKRENRPHFFSDWKTEPYLFVESIGVGYQSKVYKALHTRKKELIALKIFFHFETFGESFLARFNREVKLLQQLHHPFIIDLQESGTFHKNNAEDRVHFIALEYFQGTNLKTYIEQYGPMPWSIVLSLMIQVSQALFYMHSQGIIHRDLKPSNMLYDPVNQRMKIIDLGLGKCISQEQRESLYTTASNSSLGTPYFMPIEQWGDAKRADERSDIYSLGATAYFLLTGVAPYQQHHCFNQILDAILQKELIPIEELLKQEVPRDLLKLIKNMMSFDAKNRYASCRILEQKLKKLSEKLLQKKKDQE